MTEASANGTRANGNRPKGPRCIALVGPFQSGKTTLLEAILARTGAIQRQGSVEAGTTIGDNSKEARHHAMSVELSVATATFMDETYTFIDCPGSIEFIHDMRDRGMSLRLGSKTKSIARVSEDSCRVDLDDGRQIWAEMVLFAAGRQGATTALNLPAVGLEADKRGRLTADKDTFQTPVPHIYAVGDIIGFPSLASTSMEQGRIAACHAFGKAPHAPPEFFPYGIYSVPEISIVGMTEEQVREKKIPYECGIARFRETSRGHIMGLSSGFMKMIFALETRRLLGVHIVGEGATELIHIGQAVVNLNGTLDYFVENTFNYPTLAEAYKIAALDAWNRMPREQPSARAITEMTDAVEDGMKRRSRAKG